VGFLFEMNLITENIINNSKKYKYGSCLIKDMENSVFIRTFGNYPLVRIIDFLIYSRDFDYPITELAKNANVNFQTLKKIWKSLEDNGLVKKTRILGGAQLFKINTENPVVQKIIELNNVLCWKAIDGKSKIDEQVVKVNVSRH